VSPATSGKGILSNLKSLLETGAVALK